MSEIYNVSLNCPEGSRITKMELTEEQLKFITNVAEQLNNVNSNISYLPMMLVVKSDKDA